MMQFNMQTLPKSAKQKERDRMRLQKKFQKQFGVRQKWDQKSQVRGAPGQTCSGIPICLCSCGLGTSREPTPPAWPVMARALIELHCAPMQGHFFYDRMRQVSCQGYFQANAKRSLRVEISCRKLLGCTGGLPVLFYSF
uniref:Uncharacterized protein n=1 Tax=Lepisosteus oculatus TaxID=7918 RepID=W5LVC6_LEPOC